MKTNIWILGATLLILSACGGTVDVPEPKEDGPVFMAEVDTEDDVFNWQAGRKNYEAKADYVINGKELTFISKITICLSSHKKGLGVFRIKHD